MANAERNKHLNRAPVSATHAGSGGDKVAIRRCAVRQRPHMEGIAMHVAGSESSFVMIQAFARSSTAILTGAMFALLVAGGCGESDEVSSNDDAGVTVDGGNGSPDAIDPASVPLVGEVLTPDTCPADSNRPGSGITPGNDLHRVTLDEYPEAVCNDGSPAIAYIRRAATPAAESTWVIFLQFGGACQSWEICRDRWCSYNTSYDAARMSCCPVTLTTSSPLPIRFSCTIAARTSGQVAAAMWSSTTPKASAPATDCTFRGFPSSRPSTMPCVAA